MTIGLRDRVRRSELMDDPELDPASHAHALRGLERINRLSGASRAIWRGIRRRLPDARRLTLLDVACGSADVSLAIVAHARRDGVEVCVTGCDISLVAIDAARGRARHARVDAQFVQGNALTGELPGVFDVVLASLFLHHLSGDDAVKFLRSMGAAATRLVAVDDLVRGAAGYLMATIAPQLLTRSPVVHVDAKLSVRAAVRPGEARVLAETAALAEIEVRRHWPARFLLTARGSA